jgi:hypothetical protein
MFIRNISGSSARVVSFRPKEKPSTPSTTERSGPVVADSLTLGAPSSDSRPPVVIQWPPRRDDIKPAPLDLQRSLAERNPEAIASHLNDEQAITQVAKEVSRVSSRLDDVIRDIVEHMDKSEQRVAFAIETLTVNGRVPMRPVTDLADSLTPQEQAQVLDEIDSGYLRSCGFGSSDGPGAEEAQAASRPTDLEGLLETPSGRPEVDAKIKLFLELGYSLQSDNEQFSVSDPQGRPLHDNEGELHFSLDAEQWPSTSRRLAYAMQAARPTSDLPKPLKLVLDNARGTKLIKELSENPDHKQWNRSVSALKDRVLDNQVPMLGTADFDLVEPPSFDYNCFAHTVGITERRVDRELQVKGDDPRLCELDGYYRKFDYQAIHQGSREPEPGVEKVLVYGREGTPTHVALLKPDGFIYSKLGSGALIRHRQPEVLFGPTYGHEIIGCYQRAIL